MKLVVLGQANNKYKNSEIDQKRILDAAGEFDVEFYETPKDFTEALNHADAAIGNIRYIDKPLPENFRWFHSWAAGVDNEPFEQVLDLGALVTTSKSNGAIPIAEHTVLLMLMVARRAVNWIDAQRRHEWHRQFSPELHGKTVALIGLGNIGTEVARRLDAFGMRIIAVKRTAGQAPEGINIERVVGQDGLDDALAEADYVVVTAALTPETEGMIGEVQFRKMKKSAIYVCVSRGGLADAKALETALREGWIAGGGLDTHEIEPLPADSPFWDLPNTIVTPHNGGTTMGTSDRAVDVVVDNLQRWNRGETLRNLVTYDTRY